MNVKKFKMSLRLIIGEQEKKDLESLVLLGVTVDHICERSRTAEVRIQLQKE